MASEVEGVMPDERPIILITGAGGNLGGTLAAALGRD
jgi:hypothetical protein